MQLAHSHRSHLSETRGQSLWLNILQPTRLAFDTNGILYVGNANGLYRYHMNTGAALGRLPTTPEIVGDMAFGPDNKLYATSRDAAGAATVVRFDNLTTTDSSISGAVALFRGDGNANDSIGSVTATVSGATVTSLGKFGQQFQFNGTTNFVNLNSTFSNSTQTISTYVKLDRLTSSPQISHCRHERRRHSIARCTLPSL